jgi:outer membrane protein OmpA-like peptidoglycan-associated protein
MPMKYRVHVPLLIILFVAAANGQTPIPLQPGLTVVTALSDREGDYESIKVIEAVTPETMILAYSADIPNASHSGKPQRVSTRRSVRREDLRTSHEYMQIFKPSLPETIPGTTAIGASSAVLTELKTKGKSSFTFQTPDRQPSEAKILDALTGAGSKAKSFDDLARQLDASKASGTLSRVEPNAVPFPVLVNGTRTTVPAIHARGTFDTINAEFYFLDDPSNPIALKWTTGSPTGALQVVQITFPAKKAEPEIEHSLENSGRAEIHGIYFDFGSATIKPESDAALREIAAVMTKNPAWKLNVEGHTDNIGGEAANLDLSRRRADAVKQALMTRYHVDAARLTTTGFGATRPKEPNTTPEGRARNRRVELVRER